MADEKPPAPAATPTNNGAPTPPATAGAATAEPMTVPPIPLDAKAQPKPAAPPAQGKKDGEIKDSFRELIETIVFVVVLVLMLKTFLAEAFVIPTGSMADTLLGYHYKVPCKECGYPNLVNASSEADPQDGVKQEVYTTRCENCGFVNQIRELLPMHGQAPGGGQQ